ncbi:MAG TPA: hypothetical protein VFF67_01095 [Thermoplasmata archaeon]|nr:hypothetical protein [Thermoplasmata archaeon]
MTFVAKTRMRACTNDTASSYAFAYGSAGIQGPGFHIGISGPRNVSLLWQLRAGISRTNGHFGGPFLNAYIALDGNIYDVTNGSWLLPHSNYRVACSIAMYAYGFTCLGVAQRSNPINISTWLNFSANLSAGHNYQFYAFVSSDVILHYCIKRFSGAGNVCSPGTANLDLGSSGNGAVLLSMRIH